MNAASYGFGSATPAPPFTGKESLTLWAQPSVMGASTQLWLSRELESDTRLRLFDFAGRAVRTLTIPAGLRFGIWDGRDARGESVASGTYFAQVLDRPDAAVGRIVLLR